MIIVFAHVPQTERAERCEDRCNSLAATGKAHKGTVSQDRPMADDAPAATVKRYAPTSAMKNQTFQLLIM